MDDRWHSYDSAAGVHDRIAVPHFFAPPARDLVKRLALMPGCVVLDVGGGSGVAALLALQVAGPGGAVVALDPSIEMLQVARSRGVSRVVRGAVPGLPYPDSVFDGVLANFVLAHLADYRAALLDMARVLRPGGKLGVTAWGPYWDQHRQLWQDMAESFVGKEDLQRAIDQALPWEEFFSEGSSLEQALRQAALDVIAVEQRVYKTTMSIADFLAIRESSLAARFMHQTRGPGDWERFRTSTASEFRARFPDPIECTRDVFIAVGWWAARGPQGVGP